MTDRSTRRTLAFGVLVVALVLALLYPVRTSLGSPEILLLLAAGSVGLYVAVTRIRRTRNRQL